MPADDMAPGIAWSSTAMSDTDYINRDVPVILVSNW